MYQVSVELFTYLEIPDLGVYIFDNTQQGHSMPTQPMVPTWPTQKILKKFMLHPLPEKLLYTDF